MKGFAIILLMFTLISCEKNLPNQKELKNKFYQEKIDAFIVKKTKNCKAKAADEAQIAIDSLLDKWINASLFDSLIFPEKPFKPQAPKGIIDKVNKFEVEK